jgi:hypothetical protein
LESNSHIPPEVAQFAEVARRYCAWVESETGDPIDQKIHKPALGLKERVLQRVCAVPFRHYWNTFDPLKENEQPVCGDLPDDLADIWLDLWEGLCLFDAGHSLEANFHWRVLYDSHWGQHVLDAQRAIYAFLTK